VYREESSDMAAAIMSGQLDTKGTDLRHDSAPTARDGAELFGDVRIGRGRRSLCPS
jgi:hypothetical protein